MIEETARVISTGAGEAWVEVDRRSACGSCAASGGCGTASIARYLHRGQRIRLRAIDRVGVRPGDTVVLGLEEGAMARGMLRMYAVPLLALLLGALAGQLLAGALGMTNGDPAALAGGTLGLLAGLGNVRRFSRRVADDPAYQPVILRRTGVAGELPLVYRQAHGKMH